MHENIYQMFFVYSCTVLHIRQNNTTTSPPQINLGRGRRSRTTTQQSPHWLQWDPPNSPPNLLLTLRR